jgi:hypothetical protein
LLLQQNLVHPNVFLKKIRRIDVTTFPKYEYQLKTHKIELASSLQDNVLNYYECLEAFFFNLRSCTDSFLWEVALYFDLGLKKLYEDKEKNLAAWRDKREQSE